jgi:NADPH:quinone reductase-like Zn-dependent oxidoreductase
MCNKVKGLAKDLTIAHYMAKPDADELKQIADLLRFGSIRPVVAATYDLGQATQAEIALAKEHIRGKIVLTVR